MSEHTDATEDRPDDAELPPEDNDAAGNAEDAPQPWAKSTSGDAH